MAANRVQLIRALLRFGGSKDAMNSAEVSALPDSDVEQTVGYAWDSNADRASDDEEGDKEPDDNFYSTATRKSKLRKLNRSQQYGSNRR